MSRETTVYCDAPDCFHSKGESNHWWVALVDSYHRAGSAVSSSPRFTLEPAATFAPPEMHNANHAEFRHHAENVKVYDVCGESCALKCAQAWMKEQKEQYEAREQS